MSERQAKAARKRMRKYLREHDLTPQGIKRLQKEAIAEMIKPKPRLCPCRIWTAVVGRVLMIADPESVVKCNWDKED